MAAGLGPAATGADPGPALGVRPPLAPSPDGTWLAFTTGDYRLGLRPLPAGAVRVFPAEGVSGLRWAPDSGRLGVVGHGGRRVWEVDPVRGTAEALPPPPDGQWFGFPEYLPDGDLVLVAAGRDGRFALVRRRRPTASWEVLFKGPQPLAGPRASADGKRLAFLVGSPGLTELWVLDLESGAARRLAPGLAENPVWSPNGAALAFERPDPAGTRQVATLDPETGSIYPLGPGGFPHWFGDELHWVTPEGRVAAWSPMSPGVRVTETGVSGVGFAAWADAPLLVLYHGGGLSLSDRAGRKLLHPEGPRPTVGAAGPGPGITAGSFGIPSTGYVTDLFRPGHPGLDIAKPLGVPESQAPIVAAYPGRVVWAGDAWSGPYGGYGNLVVIDHGLVAGVQVATYYAHWRTGYVRVGEWVEAGRRLADQSDYGWATGVHLHFEVREGGTPGAWRPYFDGTPVDPAGPRYLNRALRVGDFVVASGPGWAFRVLLPLVRR